jgi:hypothetical protein
MEGPVPGGPWAQCLKVGVVVVGDLKVSTYRRVQAANATPRPPA